MPIDCKHLFLPMASSHFIVAELDHIHDKYPFHPFTPIFYCTQCNANFTDYVWSPVENVVEIFYNSLFLLYLIIWS